MKFALYGRKHVQTIVVLIILCLSLLTSTVNVLTQNQSKSELDPAPLAKLLQDVLSNIVNDKFDEALALCEVALNISLPTDIRYTHRKLYRNLVEISNLLNIAKDISLNTSQGISLDTIYRLYIAKDELGDNVNEYLSKLSRYFIDPSTRYLMTTAIRKSTENLNLKIDLELDKLLQIYTRGTYENNAIVYIKLPEKVYGGEKLYISLYVDSNVYTLAEASVKIIVMFGHVITRTVSLSIPLGIWVDVEVDTPGAEEIEAIGVNPLAVTRVKVYALAVVNTDNTTIYGYATSSTSVIYEKPNIKFYVPAYVYLGQQITITIESRAQSELNLSVYLDVVSNETLLLSTVIPPGITNITTVLPNTSAGYHSLIFITYGIGRYITSAYTYVFAVSRPRPSITMSAPDISIFPLTNLRISLYVDVPVPYVVAIYINNKKMAERIYTNSSRVEIEIEPPIALLIWRYSIVAEVKPMDSTYDSSFKEGYIYVLNLPTLIAIPGLLSMALATSSTKYVVFSLRLAKERLGKVTRRAESLPSKSFSISSSYSFRKPKLVSLYRKFIVIVSRYVEPPQKNETLREFHSRFKLSVAAPFAIKDLVKAFIDIYEEDLYSKHPVDEASARNIIKRLDDVENT